MARLARAEVFAADEVAIVHVMNRVVRRCFLLGDDPITGKNYDHRKQWLDDQLVLQAKYFGIDLLFQAIMSNHFCLILRSRPPESPVVAKPASGESPASEIHRSTGSKLLRAYQRAPDVPPPPPATKPQRAARARHNKPPIPVQSDRIFVLCSIKLVCPGLSSPAKAGVSPAVVG